MGDLDGAGGLTMGAAKVSPIRPDVPPPYGDWRDALLWRTTRNGGRQIDPVTANAVTIFRHDPAWAGVLAFDELEQSVVSRAAPPWHDLDAPRSVRPGPWTDTDTTRAQAWLRRRHGLQLGGEAIWAAVAVVADAAAFNPVREWLDPLPWDAGRRVGCPAAGDDPGAPGWLTRYLGAPDSPYVRTVSRWTAVAAVARVYAPGCKVDTVPIIEGPQGARKSTILRALVGDDWYSDTPLDLSSKDRFTSLRGVWVQELAEFDQYGRHEAGILKAFVSSQIDKYRPPYGRADVRAQRRCVMIATINPAREYLADETGGRRWLPVRVPSVPLEAVALVREERDQFWAEAREIYQSGARWWPETNDEHDAARAEQDDRQTVDAWHDRIAAHIAGRLPGSTVSPGEIMSACLNMEPSKWDDRTRDRVARCLRMLGWRRERSGAAGDDGRRGYVYRLGGETAGKAGA